MFDVFSTNQRVQLYHTHRLRPLAILPCQSTGGALARGRWHEAPDWESIDVHLATGRVVPPPGASRTPLMVVPPRGAVRLPHSPRATDSVGMACARAPQSGSDASHGQARVRETATLRRTVLALLMVDVVGFSRLMEQDEEGTTARLQAFHAHARTLVEAYDGWVVDTAGDAVFGAFVSVTQAMRCAVVLHASQARDPAAGAPTNRFMTRMGLHVGKVLVDDAHVYGDAVNIAARLEALAEPGGLWVSEAVYQQVVHTLVLPFVDLGIHTLRNRVHPLHLYRVGAPGEAQPGPGVPPCGAPAVGRWSHTLARLVHKVSRLVPWWRAGRTGKKAAPGAPHR